MLPFFCRESLQLLTLERPRWFPSLAHTILPVQKVLRALPGMPVWLVLGWYLDGQSGWAAADRWLEIGECPLLRGEEDSV